MPGIALLSLPQQQDCLCFSFIKGNFDDYPLWLCAFSKPEGIDWTIWQYSHWGEVDGIKGDVDLNIFYGNSEQWRKWLE